MTDTNILSKEALQNNQTNLDIPKLIATIRSLSAQRDWYVKQCENLQQSIRDEAAAFNTYRSSIISLITARAEEWAKQGGASLAKCDEDKLHSYVAMASAARQLARQIGEIKL